jgi:hypothetical protein
MPNLHRKMQFSAKPPLISMEVQQLVDSTENSTLAHFSTLCLAAYVGKRCKHYEQFQFLACHLHQKLEPSLCTRYRVQIGLV